MKKILSSVSITTIMLGFFFSFFPRFTAMPPLGSSGVSMNGSHSLNSVLIRINTK